MTFGVKFSNLLCMKIRTDDAVDYFGSKSKLAEALGITRSAVSQYGEYLPEAKAYRFQALVTASEETTPPEAA